MIRIRNILYPTDFSENSRYALEVACAIGRDQAAGVLLLHVLPRPLPATRINDIPAVKAEHVEEDRKSYREEMAARLDNLREEAPLAQTESLLREGDAADVITRTAEEAPCDLIVMGTHGWTGDVGRLMGSVTEEVTRKAPCPVVTVKAPHAKVVSAHKPPTEKAGAMP